VLGVAIVVLVVAHGRGDPLLGAFEAAARSALGGDANFQIVTVEEDPPDEVSSAQAGAVDGVVELSWTADGRKARIHCYLSREQRWLDREITFGADTLGSAREAVERGRLLGFAVATMFYETPEPLLSPAPTQLAQEAHAPALNQALMPISARRRTLEFAGQLSSGLGGTAAGLGAGAAFRLSMHGPLWARLFIAGRTGNIAAAQANTRNAMFGAGVAVALPVRQFELGVRSDIFANYFEATHLSDDDVSPDKRSRWLPGADLLAEGGFQLAGSAGVFLSAGIEAVIGKTEIYTHGQRVAVVPPLRAIGEFGFRIGF